MNKNRYLQWLTEKTASEYWHDSAINLELEDAIDNGAKGTTTNPFLINETLVSDREFWDIHLKDIDFSLQGHEKVEALIGVVTGYIADRLLQFYGTGDMKGYCCAQVNPSIPGDAEKMLEQARRISKIRKNIVVKIPATRAGLEVYEECAALGMNVAATVSFTVPQVLAVGEAYTRGIARARANKIKPGLGIAVLMVGRLDDYIRDVALDTHADVTESDIIQCGIAAIKQAYKIFNERAYECFLMPAGCRGSYHITELAGAKMAMSIAPKIFQQLQFIKEPFEERIDCEIDPNVIQRLMKMPEFVKAYMPDGMTLNEFITYGSTNRTLTQFVECGWNRLQSYSLMKKGEM